MVGAGQAARFLLATIAMTLGTAFLSNAEAETLVIQGSTTFSRRLLDPYKANIEAESKHELTVIPNKSMPGLIALMEAITLLVNPNSPSAEMQSHEAEARRARLGGSFKCCTRGPLAKLSRRSLFLRNAEPVRS